uniref:Trafficking protein particle complex subunit 12 n=1 Tax=Nothobranchius furzeri TaxID=105023 RepID=A0A8C6P8H7_NOTFU
MDTGEGNAQRPITLGITVEDFSNEASVPETDTTNTIQTPPKDDILLQQDSIDLGAGEFVTPQEDSSATLSESLMDRLNDQMMESVMISDSPNNSEEDDVGPIDSFLDGGLEENGSSGNKKEESEIGQNTTEIKVPVDQKEQECTKDDIKEEIDIEEQIQIVVSPQSEAHSPVVIKSEDPEHQSPKGTSPKDEPVPVCTIFSQGTQPKSLAPDGFQPTLIKSPSFTTGSGGGSDEAVTPSKMTAPLVCQPSPSLSKFFTDNGQANPASDFFDSFTAPSSFISISNPNADVSPASTPAPLSFTPEHQRSSTSSSISTPGGLLDSGAPTPVSVFGPTVTEPTTKPQSPISQTVPSLNLASSTPQAQPFNQLQAVFSGTDDPFATALSLSEVDRRHDAWLPCEETRKMLISVATQQYGPAYVDTNRLTMPGLKFDNLQGDAVKDLMVRFLGEQAAMKRQVLTASSVEQSFVGLKQLVSSKNWRAAVDLTGRLLTAHGQGYGKAGQPTSHTTDSLQLWFVRLALLTKLNLFQNAELEFEPFGNLDQPDLYYEYYPSVYPGRRGRRREDGGGLLPGCGEILPDESERPDSHHVCFDEQGLRLPQSEQLRRSTRLLFRSAEDRPPTPRHQQQRSGLPPIPGPAEGVPGSAGGPGAAGPRPLPPRERALQPDHHVRAGVVPEHAEETGVVGGRGLPGGRQLQHAVPQTGLDRNRGLILGKPEFLHLHQHVGLLYRLKGVVFALLILKLQQKRIMELKQTSLCLLTCVKIPVLQEVNLRSLAEQQVRTAEGCGVDPSRCGGNLEEELAAVQEHPSSSTWQRCRAPLRRS